MKLLFSLILIAALLSPFSTLAQTCTRLQLIYPEFAGIKLCLETDLNKLVAWIYYFILGIAGLAAFIMIIYGGFLYITSVGNPSKISEAKGVLEGAALGVALIFTSYLILKVINPELIILNLPQLQ